MRPVRIVVCDGSVIGDEEKADSNSTPVRARLSMCGVRAARSP
jgi:hypothetical protein